MPSVYAPPCVPVFEGDNGGATSPGVTADSITIVVYQPRPAATSPPRSRACSTPRRSSSRRARSYVEMLSDVVRDLRTHRGPQGARGLGHRRRRGRRPWPTPSRSPRRSSRSPSIGGPALTTAYADELAAPPDDLHRLRAVGARLQRTRRTPRTCGARSRRPSSSSCNFGDYLTKRLFHRTAEFAGDPSCGTRSGSSASCNFEQDPPVFSEVAEAGPASGVASGATRPSRARDLPPRHPQAAGAGGRRSSPS